MRNIGRALALVAGASVLTGASAIAAPGAELRTEHPSGGVLGASGYTANSFALENTGDPAATPSPDPAITAFSIELEAGSTAIPDLMFDLDPLNPAGDGIAKSFELNGGTSGLVAGDFVVSPSVPLGGGFRKIDVAVGSGGIPAGSSIEFSIDVDPLSTAGEAGSSPAGPVSGAEMSGSIVEVEFDGSTTETTRLAPYVVGPALGVNARGVVPVPSAIDIRPTVMQFSGAPWPADATVTTAAQQFLNDATPASNGQTIRVFKVEAATRRQSASPSGVPRNLFLGNVQTGGGQLFSSGLRATSFLLDRSPEDAQTASGKNVVMAYLEAADGTPGPVSLPVQVELVAPVNLTSPSLSGTATKGQTLSCDPGTWDPASPGIAYEWLRDGAPIASAAGATYDLVQEDVGTAVSCRVTATGDGGSSTESSAPTGAVADAPPAALTPPAVTGAAQVGATLTCETGTWNPADATLAVQWLRDSAPIPGATGATYSPTADDLGAALSCRVAATGPGGETVTTSAATSPVVAAPSGGTPNPTPTPTTPPPPQPPPQRRRRPCRRQRAAPRRAPSRPPRPARRR